MLSDHEILNEINTHALIKSADVSLVRNCAYTLRVGAVFEPKTGAKEFLPPRSDSGGRLLKWVIGPGECLIIRSFETFSIPGDICAYYHPLNRLAQRGIMLLNASVVEPNYEGPLSCFLVNFSSEDVEISPRENIAKITFEKVDSAIAAPSAFKISTQDYESGLSTSARKFEKSFLGVGNVAKKAAEIATDSLKSTIKWTGAGIALLVLFAQMEPLFSKYFWEKVGVSTTSRKLDESKMANEMEQARQQLKAATEKLQDAENVSVLKKQISELQSEVRSLKEQRAKPK